MEVDYKDYYPNGIPDYQGTEILILANGPEEAIRIDSVLVYNRKEILGSLAYGYKRKGLKFRFVGYDGFLASIIERMLTGDRDAWQQGHPRQKVVL